MFSAASEFNFPDADAQSEVGGGAVSALPAAAASSVDAFHQHPAFVLGIVVFGTAALVAWTTKPVARARVEGKLGPAKGEVEGEI